MFCYVIVFCLDVDEVDSAVEAAHVNSVDVFFCRIYQDANDIVDIYLLDDFVSAYDESVVYRVRVDAEVRVYFCDVFAA